MKKLLYVFILLIFIVGIVYTQESSKKEDLKNTNELVKKGSIMKINDLTQEEVSVIVGKGTQRPFVGKYTDFKEKGTYVCKQCDAPLYKSDDKFESSCGWPSFDDEIKGAVKRIPDVDGKRVEIVCANCGGHLGHVFVGEKLTPKNVRHCVNSISMKFVPGKIDTNKKAYFAGGCFWGVEYHFDKLDGVISAKSGYMGGDSKNPTYRDVSSGESGHLEVVEITYDTLKVDYETLAKLFFEIHDSTQVNGQGPDIGGQYLSAVFTSDKKEIEVLNKLIKILQTKGLKVVTKILEFKSFYEAEEYHQDYYDKNKKQPYCHSYKKIF